MLTLTRIDLKAYRPCSLALIRRRKAVVDALCEFARRAGDSADAARACAQGRRSAFRDLKVLDAQIMQALREEGR